MRRSNHKRILIAVSLGVASLFVSGCDDEQIPGSGKCKVLHTLDDQPYTSEAAEKADRPLTWSDGGRTLQVNGDTVTVTYDRDGRHYVETWRVRRN